MSATADVALARSALLTLSDLPPGWTASPHVAAGEAELDARIARCLHVEVALANTDLQPHADSQDFSGPAGQQVQSGVAVFANASLPTRWTQLYSTPAARTCLATSIGESASVTLRATQVQLPSIGDGQVGVRFTDGSLTLDAAFARRGRALAYLVVQSPSGVDEGLLLSRIVGRLSRAA